MAEQIPGINPDLDRMPSEGHAMSETMGEQNTVWRDIKTNPPKETREDILCYEPPIAGPYPSPARRYVSSGYALKHQYLCGTEDENPTHWQPLPPPPGKESAR